MLSAEGSMNLKVQLSLLPKTRVKVFFPKKVVDVISFAKKYFSCVYWLVCRRYGNIECLDQVELEFDVKGLSYFLSINKEGFQLRNNNTVLYDSKTIQSKKHVA